MSKARQLADLGNVYDDGALSNRNLIINGAMQVAQRGTSVSGQTSAEYQTVDRWRTNSSGGTYNQSQETVTLGDSTIGDFKYFLRHEVTVGDDYTGLLYRIEDVQSVPQGTVTLSFYAKGTNPNSGHIEVLGRQEFGTGGSPSDDVKQAAQDVTLTSSWQRFELQITIPSISGKTLGTNNDSLYQLQFTQPPDDDNSAAWTLDITGVQLEVGDTATPFEHRSFGDELLRCQRYFWKAARDSSGNDAYVGMGFASTSSTALVFVQNPVTMRAAPTFSRDGNMTVDNGTARTASTISGGNWGPFGGIVIPNCGSGLSVNQAVRVFFTSSGNSFQLDAEL